MAQPPFVVTNVIVPIPNLPSNLRGLRIAHVSDLHLRRWNVVLRALQDELCALEYDLLVVTGDFCCHPTDWPRTGELAARLFQPVAGRRSAYAVLGNHDDPRLAEMPEIPLEFLQNRAVSVESRDSRVELAGVEQSATGGEDFHRALPGERTHELSILLAHYPSTIFRVPRSRVDLILSGHTHGGQIRWPLLGCLWTNDALPNRMARGLHRVDDTWLYVTSGIGVTPPVKIRVNCPAELSVLTVHNAAEAGQSDDACGEDNSAVLSDTSV